MTPEPVVRVRDLTKSYGATRALQGVSFDVEPGETLGLLGPNGAGKSTTIEILEGYRDRTGGDVSVLGVDPRHGGLDWKARLGIVLQSSGDQGTATVREQIAHFAGFYPRPRDVDEVLVAVGLEHKADARIRSLSGGQRRRVDVALGVVGRPELLFLDEPTTGFDPEARRQFWQLIRSLSSDGTSIVLTTHYLDEAAQLSDRVAVVTGGRLVALGRPDELGDEEARTPRVSWLDDDGRHEVRTTEPGALVARLHADGGEPRSLEVIRPSLEDVYLDLVARAEQEAGGVEEARGATDGHRASSAGVTS
ncbi:ABC transporter ATP-binding protein [Frigoribacterium sp. CFBP9039]|uniref:ABC transporter ATP-binding protein n=1 Tax=Frigoribacterium sp. CFBP9029 TaxID=3096541 RepID=UPI002A6A3776|nr:ABC transporter ATP-binding protein [Frigoribacterium sp. CFBP9039]MDY0946146.1 ABC transporter ATP-binding protein [Frigoribacterium sp. CFBP9039]